MKTIRIISLQSSMVEEMVGIHMEAFPDFFLTFLGKQFLREFYRSFVDNPEVCALVAFEEETQQLIGGAVGPFVPDGFFKKLLKRSWFRFALAGIPAVLRRPAAGARLIRALKYRGDSPHGMEKYALLSSIAVSPTARKSGVGRTLLADWLKIVRDHGKEGAFLTTDAVGNESVNRFYRNNGWKLLRAFSTPEGRRMNYYVYQFENIESKKNK